MNERFMIFLLGRQFSDNTIQVALNKVSNFQLWCSQKNYTDLEINYSRILEYIDDQQQRGLTQKTLSNYLQYLRHYYDFLLYEGLVAENPLAFLQLKGITKQTLYTILSLDELKTIYQEYTHPQNLQIEIRNKALLGLLLFQGVKTVQLHRLTVNDLRLRTGKIRIPGSKKTNPRWLNFEQEQWLDIMTYRMEIRPQLLTETGRNTDLLFFTPIADSDILHSLKADLLRDIKKINRKVQNFHQIRASLITHWLKTGNLRKAQYKAGHRYISSTEKYKNNNLEGLQREIDQFYPEIINIISKV